MKNRPGSRISLIFRRISTFNDFVSGIAQNRIRSFELFTGDQHPNVPIKKDELEGGIPFVSEHKGWLHGNFLSLSSPLERPRESTEAKQASSRHYYVQTLLLRIR